MVYESELLGAREDVEYAVEDCMAITRKVEVELGNAELWEKYVEAWKNYQYAVQYLTTVLGKWMAEQTRAAANDGGAPYPEPKMPSIKSA